MAEDAPYRGASPQAFSLPLPVFLVPSAIILSIWGVKGNIFYPFLKKILYISGEESQAQIRLRANRMGKFSPNLLLLCETNLETIRGVIEKERPELVIIDSIQTMYNENVSAAPGSVSQVRESTGILLQLAKGLGISIFIVGHVTKEGNVQDREFWSIW